MFTLVIDVQELNKMKLKHAAVIEITGDSLGLCKRCVLFPDSPVALSRWVLSAGKWHPEAYGVLDALQASCGLSTGPDHSETFLWAKTPCGTMRMSPGSRGAPPEPGA